MGGQQKKHLPDGHRLLKRTELSQQDKWEKRPKGRREHFLKTTFSISQRPITDVQKHSEQEHTLVNPSDDLEGKQPRHIDDIFSQLSLEIIQKDDILADLDMGIEGGRGQEGQQTYIPPTVRLWKAIEQVDNNARVLPLEEMGRMLRYGMRCPAMSSLIIGVIPIK